MKKYTATRTMAGTPRIQARKYLPMAFTLMAATPAA
jgi:hypothetical protein